MGEDRYQTVAACAQFEGELEAYFEGEARPFVTSHSQACTACGTLLADLESIRQAAHDMPEEEPSRTLWPNLHASLKAEGLFRRAECLRFEDELQAYLEGEERPYILSHSADCKACEGDLRDTQFVLQAARNLPLEEPSAKLWPRLRTQLEAEGAFHVPACVQFELELPAYLEGEARPLIALHSQACATCGALLADLESIRQAARELPQEEPSRVVWANVRAQLEAEGAFREPATGWQRILPWRLLPQVLPVGALGVLLFLGSVLTLPSNTAPRWDSADETVGSAPAVQSASLTPASEDRDLARVISDLELSYKANEASMAPDLKATYQKSLVSLDGSIRECLDSLRHEPRNALAQEYLLTAYTRKAEILTSALEFDGR